MTELLSEGGLLFLVLPEPCLFNSRYLKYGVFEKQAHAAIPNFTCFALDRSNILLAVQDDAQQRPADPAGWLEENTKAFLRAVPAHGHR